MLQLDPSRVQSRRLRGDVVKFWVQKRGAGRSCSRATPWEGLLEDDCDEEAPDHDQDQFDDSAAGDHDSSTSSNESSSSDPPAPSVEENVPSVSAKTARVGRSLGKSAAKPECTIFFSKPMVMAAALAQGHPLGLVGSLADILGGADVTFKPSFERRKVARYLSR